MQKYLSLAAYRARQVHRLDWLGRQVPPAPRKTEDAMIR